MQRFMRRGTAQAQAVPGPRALFTRYQIESQIESAYSHKVTLPSGEPGHRPHGSPGVHRHQLGAQHPRWRHRSHRPQHQLEAAEEIARQLRLRDIGGLIVIDFIDMESTANQRAVEDMLRDAVRMDRARIQLGRLSRFGLLNCRGSAASRAQRNHAHQLSAVHGMGTIRGVESMSLALCG